MVREAEEPRLESREVFVHPAEVVALKMDPGVKVHIIDVRPEWDFNLFHVKGARRMTLDELSDRDLVRPLASLPENEVVFVMSNGERRAVDAWKALKGLHVVNAYIVEGGINHWLEVFKPDPCIARPVEKKDDDGDSLAWRFAYAVGDREYSAHPEDYRREALTECFKQSHPGWRDMRAMDFNPFKHSPLPEFQRKVKMKKKRAAMGGAADLLLYWSKGRGRRGERRSLWRSQLRSPQKKRSVSRN